ncbi:lysocardiolipin acyltransferase 1-like [Symsagittifera roscoffensis]|uniref:lysocardiolipin acyltransferase 1-like n=1 Tax=Symsagittifera roscoffensis TaxID=84072 RepID=UPI00307CC671
MYAAGVPETGWNLFIMNHRTRLDWYYIWLAFLKSTNAFRMAQMFKIVLKSSLSKIPGYGWSMQMSRFLFLERNWERDKEHLDTYSSMVIDHGAPHSILIFPEGTDYEPNSLLSSHSFARKNNLPAYDYVLHPRITGTVHLMQQLIAGKSLERVVNITAYYPDLIPENELYVLLGKVPKEVWYFVDIIELEDIPGVGDDDSEGKSSEQIGEWLKKLWEEKEELLKTLYEGPSDEKSINDHKHQNGTSEETADNVGVAAKKRTDEAALSSLRDRFVEHNLVSQLSGIHYALFIWWSIFSVLAVYVFSVSLPAQLIALIVVSVTVFVNIKYGDWDYLEMHLHKKRMKEQQKPL